MEAADYNFPTHYSGDGMRALTITLEEDGGTPIDLTGAEIRMQLRSDQSNSSQNVVWEFNNLGDGDSEIAITDAAAGEMELAEIKSWQLPAATYYYDLQVKDSTGFVTTYLKGRWPFTQDITK